MRRFFWSLFFILILCVAGAGAYTYYVVIPTEIEKKIIQSLSSLGFRNVTFKEVTSKRGKLALHNISLDSKSFSGIETLVIEYNLWDYLLYQRRAELITVRNLKLTGDISPTLKLTIAGWRDDGTLINTLGTIPTRSIRFENSKMEVLVPDIGGITLEYSGEFRQNGLQDIAISGTLKTAQKKLEAEARLSGNINAKGNLEIQAQSDDLQINTQNLKARRASVYLNILAFGDNPAHIALEANAGSIVWMGLPLRDTNITIDKNNDMLQLFAEGKAAGSRSGEFSAQAAFVDDIMSLEMTIYPETMQDFTGYLKSAGYLAPDTALPDFLMTKPKPVITLEGKTADSARALGGLIKVAFPSSALEFSADFLHDAAHQKFFGDIYIPRSFLPVFQERQPNDAPQQQDEASSARAQDGRSLTLLGEGKYSLSYADLPPRLDWAINCRVEPSTLRLPNFTLSAVQGRLNLGSDSDLPQSRPEGYRTDSFAFQLPLRLPGGHKAHADLNLAATTYDSLVAGMEIDLLGGSIDSNAVKFEPDGTLQMMTLEIGDISLSALMQAMGVPNVNLVGKAGGNIRLENRDGKLHITKGLVQSQQSGILQMPEAVSLQFFPGDSPEAQRIRRALKNYHYEFFEVRIDGQLDGLVMLSFLAKGLNPDDRGLEGMVDIDFKIEASLRSLFQNMLPGTP